MPLAPKKVKRVLQSPNQENIVKRRKSDSQIKKSVKSVKDEILKVDYSIDDMGDGLENSSPQRIKKVNDVL